MKISIITAVYNNREHINQCIQSVSSQNYPDTEHIIVDGDSKDGTKEIIRQNLNKSGKWISEPDKGIYDALNKGISVATGEIIGLLHSDDVFYSERVLEQIEKTFSETGCDVVYGDLLYVARDDISKVIRYWKSSKLDVRNFKKGWMPAHPTLFMKKSVYKEFGGFDLQFKIASDYDLMLRTVGSGRLKCVYLPEIITRMRVGGASNKSLKNIWQKSMEDLKALRKNKAGGWSTLFLKNFSKLGQFIKKQGAGLGVKYF